MTIACIGDIHGAFNILKALVAKLPQDVEVIQVGDFGFWPYLREEYDAPDRPVRFIDGNHDHVLEVAGCDWPNAVFVPRGTVEVVDGRRVLFLGGATSVDRAWRHNKIGRHAWFEEEVVTQEEADWAILNAGAGVDLMVTHTPPDWMIRKHFSPNGLRHFGINPNTWRDHAALRVEAVWRAVGEPQLVCGHMHKTVVDGQCRILDINEVYLL